MKTRLLILLVMNIACSQPNKNSQTTNPDSLSNRSVEQTDNNTALIKNKNIGTSASNKFTLETINENDYLKLIKNIHYISENKDSMIFKNHGKIVLPLINGKTQEFIDVEDSKVGVDKIIYSYKGLLKPIDSYVLFVTYYETSKCLLVNKKNGVITELWGGPYLSPNFKYLFSFESSLGYDAMPNGIQMLKYEKDTFKLEWELKPEDWKPKFVGWLNDSTLLIKKVVPKEFSNKNADDIEYLKLKF